MGVASCCTVSGPPKDSNDGKVTVDSVSCLADDTSQQPRSRAPRASSSSSSFSSPGGAGAASRLPAASRYKHGAGTALSLSLEAPVDPTSAGGAAATLSVASLTGEQLATVSVDLANDTLRSLSVDIAGRTGVEPGHQALLFGTKRSADYAEGTSLGSFLFETNKSPSRACRSAAAADNASPSSPSRAARQPSSTPPRRAAPSLQLDSAGAPGCTEAVTTEARDSMPLACRDDACMPLQLDDLDTQPLSTQTWSVDSDGSMTHNPTGIRISPEKSVQMNGMDYGLPPQDIEFSDRALGSGSGGVVRMGRHRPSGMNVAVKTVRVGDRHTREQMLKEIRGLILAAGSPHLIQWYAGFIGRDSSAVHVVLEYMDLGSLSDLRERLAGQGVPPCHLLCIASQILRGLHHLEMRKLLHRDVKPENILHNRDGQVKLTDFGISKDVGSLSGLNGVGTTFVGTASYMAPERMSGQDYTFKSDIWSAGMVIYELATGRYPFANTSFLNLAECVCDKPPPRLDLSAGQEAAPELCSLVARCLTREETLRPDAAALLCSAPMSSQGNTQVAELAAWLTTLGK